MAIAWVITLCATVLVGSIGCRYQLEKRGIAGRMYRRCLVLQLARDLPGVVAILVLLLGADITTPHPRLADGHALAVVGVFVVAILTIIWYQGKILEEADEKRRPKR